LEAQKSEDSAPPPVQQGITYFDDWHLFSEQAEVL
jgi:hypothetical protein